MEPLNAMRRFWETASFGAEEEKIVLFRQSKTTSNIAFNSIFTAVVKTDTKIETGNILAIGADKYFVVAKRLPELKLYKANTTVNITRLTKEYINGQDTGKYTSTTLYTNQPAMYTDISGKMQQYDLGLKSTSTRKFLLPKLSIKLIDRIVFGTENGQIDVINSTSFENLFEVQTSVDNRVLK